MPGAEKLLKLINKAQKKNTIILAFVISICLVLTLYSLGVIDFLKKVASVTPSVLPASSKSSPSAKSYPQQQQSGSLTDESADNSLTQQVSHLTDINYHSGAHPEEAKQHLILQPEDQAELDLTIDAYLNAQADWEEFYDEYSHHRGEGMGQESGDDFRDFR